MKIAPSQCWRVPPELIGKTVSAALKTLHGGLSWTEVRRLIEQRHVAVNEGLCLDEVRRMVADDEIELRQKPFPPVPEDSSVRVAYLDDELIVLEKPAGMISLRHSAQLDIPAVERRKQPTLDEVALRIIAQRIGTSRDLSALPPRDRRRHVRAVHRLDRETSGLVVFARTIEAEQSLVSHFADHSIERIYHTIVLGHPEAQTIESLMIRDRGDGLRGRTDDQSAGKRAKTLIRPLEVAGPYSLVECQLETGRTHQIRIHLTELGFPVCGDPTYRSAVNQAPIVDESDAPRLALHAHRLAFEHPRTHQLMRFEAPLPRDLKDLWTRMKQGHSQP